MSEDKRYPHKVACEVAGEILAALKPACTRIAVVGSVRRLRPLVKDIEILYAPALTYEKADLFYTEPVNMADRVIAWLLTEGKIEKRTNTLGRETWGPLNKLARHVETGIPIDLFSATEENWWNLLVCRTGPKQSNIDISTAAQKKGLQWRPYEKGYTTPGHHWLEPHSEAEVFELVGLPYKEPRDR
jgi:DNA polymerase/3'-5' exonuclease PolX